MKRLLILCLLCALLLCGCKMHIYAERYAHLRGPSYAAGSQPYLSYDLVCAMTDTALPEDAILHVAVWGYPVQNLSHTAFWEKHGLTAQQSYTVMLSGFETNWHVTGTKAQFRAFFEAMAPGVPMEDLRYLTEYSSVRMGLATEKEFTIP